MINAEIPLQGFLSYTHQNFFIFGKRILGKTVEKHSKLVQGINFFHECRRKNTCDDVDFCLIPSFCWIFYLSLEALRTFIDVGRFTNFVLFFENIDESMLWICIRLQVRLYCQPFFLYSKKG